MTITRSDDVINGSSTVITVTLTSDEPLVESVTDINTSGPRFIPLNNYAACFVDDAVIIPGPISVLEVSAEITVPTGVVVTVVETTSAPILIIDLSADVSIPQPTVGREEKKSKDGRSIVFKVFLKVTGICSWISILQL